MSEVVITAGIIDFLQADTALASLLGTDGDGKVPVRIRKTRKPAWYPCVTVGRITESRTDAGLGQDERGGKKHEWAYGVWQLECAVVRTTTKSPPLLLSQISEAVKEAFLANFSALRTAGVKDIVGFDSFVVEEEEAEQPVFKDVLRYTLWYWSEI